MKVALDTLGCKLNQAESEHLARQFTEAGHRLVSGVDEADVYILHTCTVTDTADAKSRHLLRQAHRRNPDAWLVASGCYAQRAPDDLAQIEGVGLVVGSGDTPYLLRRLQEAGGFSEAVVASETVAGANPGLRTRALVKIQDGCSSFCAYCIVPLVRGGEKSLPVAQVIAEVGQRVAEGYQEIILTGTKIGSYYDNGVGLKGLIERILGGTDVTRLRLSSLQPQELSPELIGLWRDERLCPHFHLSLQSGSDAVLRRMKRGYSVADYRAVVSLIRGLVPDVAVTTDVIVGFAGENNEEFEESYRLCQELGFARIHVFPYSPRQGTEAARLPDKVNAKVRETRRQQMLTLAKESAQNFNRQFLGRVMPVLWEKQSAGVWSGHTANYIRVYTRSRQDLTNKLLPVRLEKLNGDGVWGVL